MKAVDSSGHRKPNGWKMQGSWNEKAKINLWARPAPLRPFLFWNINYTS